MNRIPMSAPSYQFFLLQKSHQFLLEFHKVLKEYFSQNQHPFLQSIEFAMPSLFTLLIRLIFPPSPGKSPISTLLTLTYVPAYGIYLTGSHYDITLMTPFTRQLHLMESQGMSVQDYVRIFLHLIIQMNLFCGIKRELEAEQVGRKDKLIMFSLGLSKMEIYLQAGEPIILWLFPTGSTVKIQPKNKATLALLQEYNFFKACSHI